MSIIMGKVGAVRTAAATCGGFAVAPLPELRHLFRLLWLSTSFAACDSRLEATHAGMSRRALMSELHSSTALQSSSNDDDDNRLSLALTDPSPCVVNLRTAPASRCNSLIDRRGAAPDESEAYSLAG